MNVELFSVSALAKLSTPIKILLSIVTLMICFILVAILLIVFATGTTDELMNAKSREKTQLLELNSRQVAKLSADKYEEAISEANEVLESLRKRLPTSVNASNFLAQLTTNAKESGITVIESIPHPQKDYPLGFMVEIPVEIVGCATYHQLGHFVANLSNLERIITLENFQMKQAAIFKNSVYDPIIRQGSYKYDQTSDCVKYSGLPFRAKITTYRYKDNDL